MVHYIDEIELSGKKVFMRLDLNCPLTESGEVADDTRIRAVLPTIRYAMERGARLILCSHLGRPKGKRVPELSLAPVARRLSEHLRQEVALAPDVVGPEVEKAVEGLKPGGVLLLENVRFHPGETSNDPELAKALGALAEVFVNDAFAACHRAHASVVGIAEHVPVCAGGFLLRDELTYFARAMEHPVRPLVAILGGAKVSSKLGAVRHVLERVDKIILGGAMANTFLRALGYGLGASMVEEELVDEAGAVLEEARARGVPFYLPVDAVVAEELTEDSPVLTVPVQEVPDGWKIFDIGPATVRLYREALQDAKTVVWNGPMGAFEKARFSRGTYALAEAVGSLHALTIVGGGDTDRAVHEAGQEPEVTYMSTGGGAFLMLLEGKELPGVAALEACGRRNG